MQKKLMVTIVLVIILLSGLVAACAQPTPTPTPTPTPKPTPTPTQTPTPTPSKVYNWTLGNNGPNILYNDLFRDQIGPGIERATDGAVKIEILYPGDHPYANADLLAAVTNRELELGEFTYGNVSGTEPKLSMQDLPFLEPPGGLLAKQKFHHALDDFRAEVLSEWNAREILACFDGPQQLWLIDGWLEDFDSLAGKRIRVYSTDLENAITVLGGIPVRIDFGEVYTSLQTGLIDGLVTGETGCYLAKFQEVVKHMIPVQFFQGSNAVILNNDAWNELPPNLQDAITQYLDSVRNDFEMIATTTDHLYLHAAFQEYGLEIKPAPKAFMEEVRALAEEVVWKQWVERSGPGGQEALDTVIAVVASLT